MSGNDFDWGAIDPSITKTSQGMQVTAPIVSVPSTNEFKDTDPALSAAFQQADDAWFAKTGQHIPVTSAARSREKQKEIFDRAKKGEKGIYMPINPDEHPEKEMFHTDALDIPENIPESFLNQFGIHRPLGKSDPVHAKLMPTAKEAETPSSDFNWSSVMGNNEAKANENEQSSITGKNIVPKGALESATSGIYTGAINSMIGVPQIVSNAALGTQAAPSKWLNEQATALEKENEPYRLEHPNWNVGGQIVGAMPSAMIPVGDIEAGSSALGIAGQGTVVRHKSFVHQRSSTWSRSEAERRMIAQYGEKAIIFELQGSLFFGTTYELYSTLEPEIKNRDYILLDLRLVQSVDITAVHMLIQVRDMLAERGAFLLLSNVREQLPNGHNLREFFEQTGFTSVGDTIHIFPILETAIEWVEDRLLAEIKAPVDEEVLLRLQEMELFQGRKDETLVDLEERLEQRSFKAGEAIYSIGDQGRAIYLIRRGEIRIMAPVGGSRQLHHVATVGRGDFFGGLAFLDGRPRSDNAIAYRDTDLYILTLENFNQLADEHKRLAFILITALSRTLAHRLRHANGERTLLQA